MTLRFVPQTSRRSLRLVISTALAAGLLAGCTASGPHPSKFAASAQTALGKGQVEKAVTLAEQAVQADGRNASLRLLLANAYLRAGRFESARTAYDDAMELGEDGSKAALSLVLADIALGRNEAAIDTLNTYRDSLPAADLGLALALAGQTHDGVIVLTNALRGGENTARIRQNLAYVYALDGSWREARIMAAQDVPADKLGARMQEWAAMTGPEDTRQRVASLMGVPLRADMGQPAALALANFPAVGKATAQSAQADVPQAAALATAAVAELPPVQQQVTPAAPTLADASAEPAPAQLAAIDLPPSQAAQGMAARPAIQTEPQIQPVRHTAALAAPVAVTGGTHVIQLGAFSSREGAQRAWRHYTARNPSLKGRTPIFSSVTLQGRTLWRVQAAGFAGFASARSMCGAVKARGGACLVMVSPGTHGPVQTRAIDARFARR